MNRITLLSIAFFFMSQAVAQVEIEPSFYQFNPQQINYSSQPKSFQITNTGDDPVTIHPADIHLTGKEAQTTDLSVLTYNIWHDNQNWPQRLERMLPEIEELDPDIIGLQEVIQRLIWKTRRRP
ncbi:MAG: endonuclease/exonuclease/phosphatase family protein [Bacteroidales bacterium]|nr:endonuclease/exonuclease/phosphatase family protein [Bacteroidales bacterium]